MPLADFAASLDGWFDPVAFGVGHDGAFYVAARRSSESLRKKHGLVEFPKSMLESETSYLVVRSHGATRETLVVSGESLNISYVQPHPDGVLVAGARCHWRSQGAEKNAVVIGWDGQARDRITLGDGLNDVRVAGDGTIWASYFDEGIFGNFGWSSPGPEALGASGLVAFDARGAVQLAYDAEAAGTDSICDAYATNLADDGAVWVYFYTEFPIVRIQNGAYRVWNYGLPGASALAVRATSHRGQALLFGDHKEPGLARVVALGADGSTRVVEELIVTDNHGAPIEGARAWGRGHALFFFKDRQVLGLEDW